MSSSDIVTIVDAAKRVDKLEERLANDKRNVRTATTESSKALQEQFQTHTEYALSVAENALDILVRVYEEEHKEG